MRAAGADIPDSWIEILSEEIEQPYFETLQDFVASERVHHLVYPSQEAVYRALHLTPPDETRVVLLGQDPYHKAGQAHGLCFSVPQGTRKPPSLVNIFKELTADIGGPMPESGSLIPWARQGVLLLNTVLTVRAHEPASHKDRGWEHFTDAIIRSLAQRPNPIVFVLWGTQAAKKRALIDEGGHVLIQSAHPSPLSAYRGFFGSRPFSGINDALKQFGDVTIDWRL